MCIATYNGELYIAKQIQSILEQIQSDDEIVVVDDCSTDATVSIINQLNDRRIRIFINEKNCREVYSFNRAIALARHDLIFLADQDDLWMPGRVALMKRHLVETKPLLISTNFEWMDADERPIHVPYDGVHEKNSEQYFKNIADIFLGKTNYFGCAMAFRRELMALIHPIPEYVESHDLWIALAANLAKSNMHLNDSTFRKRRHNNNATSTSSKRSLYFKLRARWIFARSLWELKGRLTQHGIRK